MEQVRVQGRDFNVVGVWHYSGKAVVLLDMGLCVLSKAAGSKWEVVKVLPAIDVPKIGKEIYNLHQDYLLGKVKETQHKIKQGYKNTGYSSATNDALRQILGLK